MKRLLLILVLFIIVELCAYDMESLVDVPIAGMLQRGEASIFTEFYKDNGMLIGMRIGLFNRLEVGMSYGAENIVGNQDPDWHDQIEFHGKFRLLDERYNIPAMALGFDSQGHGRFNKLRDEEGNEIRRYDIKSKGAFFVMSKNFGFFGNLGVHLGCNYSLEDSDDNRSMNIFTGIDKMLGDVVVATVEYDMALNENGKWLTTGEGEPVDYIERGYLNAGIGIFFTDDLYLQLKFNDLLQSREDTNAADRSLTIRYYFDYKDEN